MAKTVVVTGANRGLGLEFCRQYRNAGWTVIALARSDSAALDSLDVERVRGDVTVAADRDRLTQTVGDRGVDVLVNNAGVFGPKPEAEGDLRQSLGSLDEDVWEALFRVNVIAPTLLAEQLLAAVARGGEKKIAFISSVMGSIEEAGGGLYAYRSSKCALNNAAANLARDVASRGVMTLGLCPGWVQTDMGGEGATVTPEDSVAGMRRRIDELAPESSGSWRRYDGESIAW